MTMRAIVSVLAALFCHGAAALDLAQHADIGRFVRDVSGRNGLDEQELSVLFADVRLRPDVLAAMARPAERLPWHAYAPRFVNKESIAGGRVFLRENHAALARAEQAFGVPAAIVTAIIGVETRYGRNTGSYPTLDAITTLAFMAPRRQDYFRRELENLILLAREDGMDLRTLQGSYAGAIGEPQFMPGSYRRYAVDFDGDGRRDLAGSTTDAIGSVANYLQRHGWLAGAPVAARARVRGSLDPEFVASNPRPVHSLRELAVAGVEVSPPGAPELQTALLRFEGADGPLYVAGYRNFYAITRYNHSVNYALAVFELSEQIRAATP